MGIVMSGNRDNIGPTSDENPNANPVTDNAIQNGPEKNIGKINLALMDKFGEKIGDLTTQELKGIADKLDIKLSLDDNKNHLMKEIYLKQFANATDPKKKDAPYLIDCTNKTTMKTNQCKDDGSTDIGNAKSTSNIINSNIKNALNNSDFTNKNIFFPSVSPSVSELEDIEIKKTPEHTGFIYYKTEGKGRTKTAFRYYDELLILPPQVYLYMATKNLNEMTIEFDTNEFKTSDGSVSGSFTNDSLGKFSIKLTKDEDSYKQTLTEVNGMPVAPQLQKSLFSPLIDKSTIIEYDANHNSKTNTYERDEQKSWSLSMPSMSSMPSINLSDNSSKLEENIKIWKNHFVASYKEILAKLSKEILAKKEIKFNENEFLEEKELFKKRIIVLAISRSIVLQEKFLEQIKNIIIAYDDAKGTIKKKLSRLGFTSELYDFVREVNRIGFEDHKD